MPSLVGVDGRLERSRRTRSAIIHAARNIIDERERPPQVKEIAYGAEVGLRTVYQHFGSVDDIIGEALALEPVRNLVIEYLPKGAK